MNRTRVCRRTTRVLHRYRRLSSCPSRVSFTGFLRHHAAQRLGHELPAQAMAEQRDVFCKGIANQRERRRYPRQVVVHAHRPAHEHESGKRAGILGHRLALVDKDHLPGNGVLIEEQGKVPGTFGGRMAEDGDGFHGYLPISSISWFTRLTKPAGSSSCPPSASKA